MKLIFLLITLYIFSGCADIFETKPAATPSPQPVTLNPAENITYCSMKLTWTPSDSLEKFAAYKIFYDTLPGVTVNSHLASIITFKLNTDYSLENLIHNTRYYIRIFVFNSDSSIASNEITATTVKCTCENFDNERQGSMVLIPAGCFVDDSTKTAAITKTFFIDTTETTHGQWDMVMGKNMDEYIGNTIRKTCDSIIIPGCDTLTWRSDSLKHISDSLQKVYGVIYAPGYPNLAWMLNSVKQMCETIKDIKQRNPVNICDSISDVCDSLLKTCSNLLLKQSVVEIYLKKPVNSITFYHAIMYCNRRSNLAGMDTCYTYTSLDSFKAVGLACDFSKNGFRLPAEDEWEYAYRAGSITDYYWGQNRKCNDSLKIRCTDDAIFEIDPYAWWSDNSDSVQEVAEKLPNAFGLYDMAGNAAEFTGDFYGANR
ncbi:MAG: SUMF1/EgtB/PvdO family nonheme iron enzyme, partial [bacterium]